MTHPEKLNKILYVLLDIHRKRLGKQSIDKQLTFAFICETVADVTDDWEIEFLKRRLISDGYIKVGDFDDGEPPEITQSGIRFIQQGAYERARESQDIERNIKRETLKKYKYDRWVFAIAVITLAIAIISLFYK